MLEKDILSDKDYMALISAYFNDEHVQSLKNVPHHDSNRLNHSLKVSYLSYNLCKKMGLDYKCVAKAGLLHDFYFNRIEECSTIKDKITLFMNEHPEDALKNAEERFDISPLEKDIILSHMWPASKHLPKHRESFVVSLVDKFFSVKEFGRKLSYNLTFVTGAYCIFVMYSIFK